MFRRIAVIVWGGAVLAGAPAAAQTPTQVEGLGSLAFPNSGSPAAQADFHRGVLLLHSFEYGDAARAFRAAQAADPAFALAYWGEAMTYTHPIWNQKDREAGLAALARYAPTPAERATRAPTERERAYVAAVDVLYGDGPKARLDTLYAAAMQEIAAAYADDLEAQTFYALALLGLSQGDRNVPTYMEAGAIALAAFAQNPDHPGAAHYTIHAFDDPTHAPLAMAAARRYGRIAPDAAHAQHMTSHIFLARGMWDDVVAANVRADNVTDRLRATRDQPPTSCGHYNEWLMYGYQQQGRYAAAAELLAGCRVQALAGRRGALRSYTYMRNLHLADTRAWESEAAEPVAVTEATVPVQLMEAWGSGMAALGRGDRSAAEARLAFLVGSDPEGEGDWVSPYLPVWRGTLAAALLVDEGDAEGALAEAGAAADYEASLPVDFGPPVAFKPARELEGEILLALQRPDEALRAFGSALARTPNRIHSLVGHARAAAAVGHREVALEAHHRLMALLGRADVSMTAALLAQGAETH